MTDKVEEGLTAEEYKRAIDVQDACNLSGVVHDFSRVMTRVWVEARKEYGRGTEWVNTHPIVILYSNKISSLCGSEDSEKFSMAYDYCKDKSNA
jgi:hypothetical protein